LVYYSCAVVDYDGVRSRGRCYRLACCALLVVFLFHVEYRKTFFQSLILAVALQCSLWQKIKRNIQEKKIAVYGRGFDNFLVSGLSGISWLPGDPNYPWEGLYLKIWAILQFEKVFQEKEKKNIQNLKQN